VESVSDNCSSLSASNVTITRVTSDEEEDASGGVMETPMMIL
jgi:hypothetical protein